jgi:hypothetical protein
MSFALGTDTESPAWQIIEYLQLSTECGKSDKIVGCARVFEVYTVLYVKIDLSTKTVYTTPSVAALYAS